MVVRFFYFWNLMSFIEEFLIKFLILGLYSFFKNNTQVKYTTRTLTGKLNKHHLNLFLPVLSHLFLVGVLGAFVSFTLCFLL